MGLGLFGPPRMFEIKRYVDRLIGNVNLFNCSVDGTILMSSYLRWVGVKWVTYGAQWVTCFSFT